MTTLKAIDIAGQLGLIVFATTFYWIVRTVRKEDPQSVKDAVKNPILPNLDLAFIPWVYRTYINMGRSILVPVVSLASALISLIAILISIFGIGQ